MVTIKDIARESGYSISTVSRVLNHRRDVSPDARKKIEEIVALYNFVPNNNAKQLKLTASKTIGVLLKGTSNMLFADIVEVIQKKIAGTEYTSVIDYLDEDADEVEEAKRLLRERKPLGILFLGGNPKYFERGFEQIKVPCVLVTTQARHLHFANLSSVATDDTKAAECALDVLMEHGHRKIGIIGGDLFASFTSKQRYLGCIKSFEKHGCEFQFDRYYAKARFSYDSGYDAAMCLMKQAPDITAIFTRSDVMAIGAVRALRDMGLGVPENVSVVGFDGTPYAEYYNPRLAAVKQQSATLAQKSVDILFAQIEFGKAAVHEIVPFEFVNGESIRKIN